MIATNKGTGALTNITVSDPQAPGCGGTIATLAPARDQVFNCQLTAGVGTTVNTASASVTPPTGPALTASDPAGFVVPAPYARDQNLRRRSDGHHRHRRPLHGNRHRTGHQRRTVR